MKAYRAFTLGVDGNLYALGGSVHRNDVPAECEVLTGKRPRLMFRAYDEPEPEPLGPHDAPAKECRCGYYAMRDVRDCWDATAPSYSVLAAVEAYGFVQEHESGIRAQFMRVTELFTFSKEETEFLRPIAERYECQIREVDPKWKSVSTLARFTFQGGGMIAMNTGTLRFGTGGTYSGVIASLPESETKNWFQRNGWRVWYSFVAIYWILFGLYLAGVLELLWRRVS